MYPAFFAGIESISKDTINKRFFVILRNDII